VKYLRAIVLLAVGLSLLGAGFSQPAVAQAQTGQVSLRVTPAFDGYFKNGEWLAVWVEIENSGKNIEAQLSVQITSSATQATYALAVSLPSGARKRLPLYILPNNFSRELEVQLTGPDGLLVKQKITVRPQANLSFLVGLVARERGGLALLNGVSLPGQERPKVIVDVSLEDLPEQMQGFRSFDLVVFNDIDTSRLTLGQAAALADWVQQGGRLVIGGGSGAAVTLAGLPAALRPVSLTGQADLRAEDLKSLVDFAGGSAIGTSGSFVSSKIDPLENASLLAGDKNLPLLVESRYGSGQVDFVALNLSSAPFNSWPDTIKFWNQLLAPTGEYSQNLPADISQRQMYNMDVVGNLSNIPALDLPSIQWLGILLAVYILLVGPVNYVILRRLRRLQLAWVTIPALTLLFSAGTFGIGSLLHGSDVILNQIAIITPNGSGAAAVTNYLGLFSPSQRSYSLAVNTPGLLSPIIGNDGNSWGPAGPLTSGTNLTFIQGEQPRVSGLSIDQWSFQAFSEEERWDSFGGLSADLRIEEEKIAGTVRNDTGLPLTDAFVVVGSNFVRLGDLAAGAEKPVELDLTTQANNQMGMPLSYRLYDPSTRSISDDNRMMDIKRSLVSRLVDANGSKFSSMSSSLFPGRNLATRNGYLTATLFAWIDQVPPDVKVEGALVKKQVIGMLNQEVELKTGLANVVTVPAGMIPASMSQVPSNGGICGNGNVTGVTMQGGSAEFKYQLPAMNGYYFTELRLFLSQDGPQGAAPGIALYDWSRKSWIVVKDPVMGVNTVVQPAAFIDPNHFVRVQVTGNANLNGFCTYIDLGLKAEKVN
jgi:hypothetical protein